MYSGENISGNLADSPRIKIMSAMVDRLGLEGKNILDIGCHDGTFLSLMKNKNNNFFGLDASDWAVEKSRRKNIDVQQYFFDDSNRLPHEDDFFDLVAAGEIIEHIFDTDFFLDEVRRVLKPTGYFLISTPNISSLGRRLQLFFGISPAIEISPNENGSVGHIRYFTFRTLKNLLRKHKFKILNIGSDCVNFSNSGRMKSVLLAKLFPTLGASIICLARKK